ncbi:hypothetical protein ACGTNG_12720 [Halomonas sp. 1390]
MSARYIAWQGRTPRCDLPGSPFTSRKAAKEAAAREGIANPTITPVRRSA